MSNLPGQKTAELWFATNLTSQKVRNLTFNPACEVLMTNGAGQLMLGGQIEVITDPELKKQKWQPWMEQEYETHSLDYFARWYMSFSDQASIKSPQKLKEIVVQLRNRIRG